MKLSKKGQFGNLQNAAIGLGIFFIIVALIATLLGEFQGTQVTNVANCGLNSTGGTTNINYDGCPLQYNITGQGLTDVETLSNFGTIVVIVVVMVIILGLLFLFQRGRSQ